MVFAESTARLLLVLHTVVAVACVGATTHLVLWLRKYRRGQITRIRAVRRFAWLSVGLYAAAFVGGNLIYPTYKVRVRAQFLESPGEVTREVAARNEASRATESRYGEGGGANGTAAPSEGPARRAAKAARWFDVKEHWVALGFALAVAVAIMLAAWNGKRDGPAPGGVVFGLAIGACAAAWLGAVVGVVVSSFRAVGSL